MWFVYRLKIARMLWKNLISQPNGPVCTWPQYLQAFGFGCGFDGCEGVTSLMCVPQRVRVLLRVNSTKRSFSFDARRSLSDID